MKHVVHCPAKINTFLSVGPRERRGYHPLRTIFQAISLYDILEIEQTEGEPHFECCEPGVPSDNTVTRALRLMSEIAPIPNLRIKLTKNIPLESGLGGGSSDAGGLLRGVIKLLGTSMFEPELQSIATTVGVDVPFFLVGGRAKGERYGERLTPLEDLPKQWLVVARPAVGSPTAEAYGRLDDLEREWREFPDDADVLYNDFEKVAPRESRELIERLIDVGASDAALTGSGSAVFGRFANELCATEATAKLLAEGVPFVKTASTITRFESQKIES